MGTILVHLLAGIVFYSVKITGLYTVKAEVQVETTQTSEVPDLEKLESNREKLERAQKIEDAADAFIAGQLRRNIGVNQADKSPSARESDLQQVQQEIEAARQQIASVQQNLERQAQPEPETPNDVNKEAIYTKKKEKIAGKQAVFKGPTNIYFDLPDRLSRFMYVPVYKCQSYGKVVVFIVVNPVGNVETASIDKANSHTDDCLQEAALDAAKRSRFSASKSAQNQKGTITYLFVAQ